ncbi:uncharacterized protein TRIADDRAFT_59005 [Trichoplax adhaerens]|uniref:Band 7 domain-containing protein n=1 Tax=Trichoplax adhaerens TaxID=10228 RepID=B3S496_TRIAD|nr:hypothetical protein TRIADDRAFT_59005 [Trichoplax adhaerens]EDV22419.1 hypothetical protein TRIADDRAFT_59005 [Trichoplax adhaerens]|eukprot:XP_002114963.1 hypothetical protein TRIADDRAFT_59005 [Trichoplax adhaerens]
MGNCHTTGPNEALVVSGACCGSGEKRYVHGGWAWAWCGITDVQRISLNVMTLNPLCESVETAEGVALTVTSVTQCKIMTGDLLPIACEQFLGRNTEDIENIILQTLEGHLRSILGTLTVEEVYKDRDRFATLVREVASPDVGRMGIEILSFTIKDIMDKVDYLNSLGKSQTAVVKRDADIGVAEANRDAGIRKAEAERVRMDVRYTADTNIADSRREYEMAKAAFDQEINSIRAEAELSYELQCARIKQKIRSEEIQIEVVERRKEIDIEEKEILRKDKELIATVKRPAEAESFKVETIAEGRRAETVAIAQAEAMKIKAIGSAEATAIEAIGKAEAERMRQKAAAYKKYGDAALVSLVLEALPTIAAEITAPLSKTEDIVILGGKDGSIRNEITNLVGQLPPAVQALTGVNISKAVAKIPGAQIM